MTWLHTNPSKFNLVLNVMNKGKIRKICIESTKHNWASLNASFWYM